MENVVELSNIEDTRYTFDANTNLNELTYDLKSEKNINRDEVDSIINCFNKYGAVIVQHKDVENSKDILLELGKYFGSPIGHDRSDSNGITTIANLKGYEGYLGASYTDHPLHTGGVYSDTPPIVLLLQCVKPSSVGGDSFLVSSKKVYDYLSEVDSKGLELLKEPGTVTIKRGVAEASRAIFDKNILNNGSYMFSFRCDDIIRFEINPASLVTTLGKIKEYIDRPENQVRVRLKENQILICDNSSVMHARSAFPKDEDRLLLRLTLDGKPVNTESHQLVLGFK
ncbi:TauD/TfdA family dioxygenase [Marinomonas sp. PE14-40]|uniref:TauD/TfdA family dioxygenase n=1 Tax=Marinomonas sp. PE14-40 TaxID=3060621 RepID=UPI003F676B95